MLVWVGVRTTDVHEKDGHLLEAAAVVTTDELEEVETASTAIFPVGMTIDQVVMPQSIYADCVKSGLIGDIRRGRAMSRSQADDFLYGFVQDALPGRKLAGASLAGRDMSFDRRWLRSHLPRFDELFGERSVDVATVEELARRWSPFVYEERRRQKPDRALSDARCGVEDLRYYRKAGFFSMV